MVNMLFIFFKEGWLHQGCTQLPVPSLRMAPAEVRPGGEWALAHRVSQGRNTLTRAFPRNFFGHAFSGGSGRGADHKRRLSPTLVGGLLLLPALLPHQVSSN